MNTVAAIPPSGRGRDLWGVRRRTALALLALGAAACAPDASDAADSDEPAQATAGIVNGSEVGVNAAFYGLVAIYHPGTIPGTNWYPRPCSGTIVRSTGGWSTVLTARHCITNESTIDGQVADAANIRLLPGAAPGLPNPNPPTGAVVADSVFDFPGSGIFPTARDMALVFVHVDWSAYVTPRFGMWVGDPAQLVNVGFMAMGYGINVNDPNCHANMTTTGAGVARVGSTFIVHDGHIDGLGGQYQYNDLSSGNNATICGDSGGPDYASLGINFYSVWTHQIGTHSTGGQVNTLMASTATNRWLQDSLGGLYLSPHSAPRMDFSLGAGNAPILVPAAPSATTAIYDPTTHRISIPFTNLCLAATATSGATVVASCQDVPAQRWNIGTNLMITSASSGSCLTAAANNTVTTAPCDIRTTAGRAQLWAFHPQP